MHDIGINRTTNVENLTQFNTSKNSSKFVADIGRNVSDYFVMDFEVSELKQVRLRNNNTSLPNRSNILDGYFQIPTFQEVIDFCLDFNSDEKKENPDFKPIGI